MSTATPLRVIYIVICVLTLAGIIGAAIYLVTRPGGTATPSESADLAARPGNKSAPSESADRDYFAVLLFNYEITAVGSLGLFMLEDAGKFPCFRAADNDRNFIVADTEATKARILVNDICSQECQELERQALAKKKVFLTHHHLDYKDYTDTFKRNYPERDLIFEEIKQMTKERVRSKIIGVWSARLLNEQVRISRTTPLPWTAEVADAMDKQWWEYRRSYLKREVPKMTRELREQVRAMPSVREMASKIR
jgi:hypothetical protein